MSVLSVLYFIVPAANYAMYPIQMQALSYLQLVLAICVTLLGCSSCDSSLIKGNFEDKIRSLRKAADTEKIQIGRKMLETMLEGADDMDLSELHIPRRNLRASGASGCMGPYSSYGPYGCPPPLYGSSSPMMSGSMGMASTMYMHTSGPYSMYPTYGGYGGYGGYGMYPSAYGL
ncbi:hypothetical protein CEUSTIGMA_g2122.t1 [Chlamydomonas eustigma]|uniref:Uncharacterized protein n=1 Tax=Chlamydomonas eustigma TaxID=1157962 RepID=A0A250WV06_9CHLO|nr:hypothetical protein CEUSTIGMA_g2122.t1 [Chlamydomonas eustigma]|eukprot:GAX74674.1 hypothetical protein CEUSTIGMA_g2122.t1 [Chlamydomonas eustigma]